MLGLGIERPVITGNGIKGFHKAEILLLSAKSYYISGFLEIITFCT